MAKSWKQIKKETNPKLSRTVTFHSISARRKVPNGVMEGDTVPAKLSFSPDPDGMEDLGRIDEPVTHASYIISFGRTLSSEEKETFKNALTKAFNQRSLSAPNVAVQGPWIYLQFDISNIVKNQSLWPERRNTIRDALTSDKNEGMGIPLAEPEPGG